MVCGLGFVSVIRTSTEFWKYSFCDDDLHGKLFTNDLEPLFSSQKQFLVPRGWKGSDIGLARGPPTDSGTGEGSGRPSEFGAINLGPASRAPSRQTLSVGLDLKQDVSQ